MTAIRNIITQDESTTTAPHRIGATVNVTWENSQDLMQAAGWRIKPAMPPIADGETRIAATFMDDDGTSGKWEVTDRLVAEVNAEAEQAEAQRIGALAQQYGALVGALAAYLARVGWSIPCEAAAVTADLLQRDLTGQLTADQKDAKSNVADTYMLLQAAGVSNADIAAIWEVIKP